MQKTVSFILGKVCQVSYAICGALGTEQANRAWCISRSVSHSKRTLIKILLCTALFFYSILWTLSTTKYWARLVHYYYLTFFHVLTYPLPKFGFFSVPTCQVFFFPREHNLIILCHISLKLSFTITSSVSL